MRRVHPSRIYPGGSKPKTYSGEYIIWAQPLENTDYHIVELEEVVSTNSWHRLNVVGFTQTEGIPGPKEYFLDAERGILYFHKSNAARKVIITYQGLGTPMRMSILNEIGATGVNISGTTIKAGMGITITGNAQVSGGTTRLSFSPWTAGSLFVGICPWDTPTGAVVSAQTHGTVTAPIQGAASVGQEVYVSPAGLTVEESSVKIGVVASMDPSILLIKGSGDSGGSGTGGDYDWYILKQIEKEYS